MSALDVRQQLERSQRSLIQALGQVNEALQHCFHNDQNGHYIGDEKAVRHAIIQATTLVDGADLHLREARRCLVLR